MSIEEAIEIGKANEILKKAQDLVDQAFVLLTSDPIAKKHLDLQCKIGWSVPTWHKLNEAFAASCPDDKSKWHLRAFDHFGLRYGSDISTSGMCDGFGG